MALSQSCFFKWRCLIALASVDAKLDPNERKFFSEQLNQLKGENISMEQMQILSEDLKVPKQPEVFFIRVEDPLEKLDLLRMAYFLFNSDGEFEVREQQVYEYLKTEISKSLDIDPEILDELAKMEMEGLAVSIRPLIMRFIEKKKKENKMKEAVKSKF